MKITQIQQHKRNKNMVHLYVDDVYKASVYIDEMLKSGLVIGKEVDEEALNEAIRNSRNYHLLNLCLGFIAHRSRSEKEIRDYIKKKIYTYKYDPHDIDADAIVEKLSKYHYVNDDSFAENWATARIKKGVGPYRLKLELAQKGIDKEKISEVVNNLDRESIENAKQMLSEKYLKKHKFKDDREKDWKLKQFLMSKGF